MGFWIVLVILIILWKCKSLLSRLWSSINSNTKIKIIEKPSIYRNYSKYIELSEIVHWDVSPEMGAAQIVVEREVKFALTQLGAVNPTISEITMEQLAGLWDNSQDKGPNHEILSIFFKVLAKHAPKETYDFKTVIHFISVAV